ncbi:MAG: hypothetical protein LBQ28_05920 [Prevotellaceae bacterium]|jgi:hypothetical protein|nr:hypothetical protein [Prevotellaceae bacterium]
MNIKEREISGDYSINDFMSEIKETEKNSNISVSEIEAMKQRISEWLKEDNINKAKGHTRTEIFGMFGNELQPIAYISPEYLKYLGNDIIDNRVYSGKGYFIEHAVNHHPEVDTSKYVNIQEILSNPDDVKIDDKLVNRNSLIFIKQFDRHNIIILSVYTSDTEKLVFHKSFFISKKIPYNSLKSVRDLNSSLVGATSTISPTDNSAAAGNRLSGRNDDTKIQNSFNNTNFEKKLDNQRKKESSLIFIKKYDKYGTVIVSLGESDKGKIVFHKSFFYQKNNHYTKFNSVMVKLSLVDDQPTISPVDKATAAGALPALNDDTKIQNFINNTKFEKNLFFAII